MKKLLLLFSLLATLSLSSCDDRCDNFDLYEVVVGRTWSGDLGFYQNNDPNLPLDSYVYLGANGFGSDKLRYVNNGQWLDELTIQWRVYGDDTLYINYGQVDVPRELRNISYYSGQIRGNLYINGLFYNTVTLYMQ